MEELKNAIHRLGELWHFVLGAISAGFAAYRIWRRHGVRVVTAYRVGLALHAEFGRDAAKQIAADLKRLSRMQLLHHSRLQLIEERLNLAVYICSAEGDCEWVSEAITNLFGIDREKFVGYGWLEAIVGDEREGVHKKWTYAIKNGLPYEARYTVRHQRTHKLTVCRTEAFPVFSGEDKVLSFYVGFVEKDEKPE